MARQSVYDRYMRKTKEDRFIKRKCLKCGKEFSADGRYTRLCNPCKIINDGIGRFSGTTYERGF